MSGNEKEPGKPGKYRKIFSALNFRILNRYFTVYGAIGMLGFAGSGMAADAVAWWNPDWQYRLKVAVDQNPMVIKLDSGAGDFWPQVKKAGEDIRFIAADNVTECCCRAWRFDYNRKEMSATVELPRPTFYTMGNYIWIYYGNRLAAKSSEQSSKRAGNTDRIRDQIREGLKFEPFLRKEYPEIAAALLEPQSPGITGAGEKIGGWVKVHLVNHYVTHCSAVMEISVSDDGVKWDRICTERPFTGPRGQKISEPERKVVLSAYCAKLPRYVQVRVRAFSGTVEIDGVALTTGTEALNPEAVRPSGTNRISGKLPDGLELDLKTLQMHNTGSALIYTFPGH
ncbi:MAG: hypothetical protein PHV59_12540 [Victivallales bacterium]|nr:hypothetical protein [Victivallales bacterium]